MARIALIAAAAVLFTGCSAERQAAAPPKIGSPAHSWQVANDTWKAGDYEKTLSYLTRLTASDNEYRDRARMWMLVTSAGMAQGYLDLSNAYESGAKISKDHGPAYRRRVSETRNAANTLAMQYAETIHGFMDKNKDPQLKFDFPFPAGSASEPPQLGRVLKGLSMQDSDHAVLTKAMLERGLVKFAAALGGADGDLEKAKAAFAAPAKETALLAVAKSLVSTADLYSQKKLDLPKRGNALCKEAEEALAYVPANLKARKEVDAKVKEGLKKFKIAS